LEGLGDGLYGLFSQRLELFRLELLEDVQRMGVWALVLVVSSVVVVLGYGMLNVAAVLAVATYTTGSGAMALTAAILGFVNLAVAAAAVRLSLRRLANARVKMHVTLDEFKKDRKWLREINEPSPSDRSSTPT
jgi:uncharacterized membrane protein YqjE